MKEKQVLTYQICHPLHSIQDGSLSLPQLSLSSSSINTAAQSSFSLPFWHLSQLFLRRCYKSQNQRECQFNMKMSLIFFDTYVAQLVSSLFPQPLALSRPSLSLSFFRSLFICQQTNFP